MRDLSEEEKVILKKLLERQKKAMKYFRALAAEKLRLRKLKFYTKL